MATDVCTRHSDVSREEFHSACRHLFDHGYFGDGGAWPVFHAPIAFDGNRWQFTN